MELLSHSFDRDDKQLALCVKNEGGSLNGIWNRNRNVWRPLNFYSCLPLKI